MEKVYSVSQINKYIKGIFLAETFLERVAISGEVSNCTYHSSGHIYFTLKDATSRMSCVMFAGNRRGLEFVMKDGMSVIAIGQVSVYERDGKYQLYASRIVREGYGELYEKLEILKKKLSEEGLFSDVHKQAIPYYAKTIGIVTAPEGAAIRDMVNVSARRNPYVQLILYPSLVQGDGAAHSIAEGIRYLDAYGVDLIIIGRGGGSFEDLFAFNEEEVVRAVYACRTPIISAVGHEVDTTLSDFAADLRAATPSAAAELAVRRIDDIYEKLDNYSKLLNRDLKQKTSDSMNYCMTLEERLERAIRDKYKNYRIIFEHYLEKLKILSPLNRLGGGYSYIRDEKNEPVRSVSDVTCGDSLLITVPDGEIDAEVTAVRHIN